MGQAVDLAANRCSGYGVGLEQSGLTPFALLDIIKFKISYLPLSSQQFNSGREDRTQQRNSWTLVLCSCPQVIHLIGCQEDRSPIILIRIGLSCLTISKMNFLPCCLKVAIKHCQLRQLSAIDHWRQVLVPAITVWAMEIITSDLMRIIRVLLLGLRLVHACMYMQAQIMAVVVLVLPFPHRFTYALDLIGIIDHNFVAIDQMCEAMNTFLHLIKGME